MSNEIDKLFKNQLSDRSFEWKESYWDEAAAVIAAARRRRRRKFLLLFGIGVLTVLSASLLFLLLPVTGEKQPGAAGKVPSAGGVAFDKVPAQALIPSDCLENPASGADLGPKTIISGRSGSGYAGAHISPQEIFPDQGPSLEPGQVAENSGMSPDQKQEAKAGDINPSPFIPGRSFFVLHEPGPAIQRLSDSGTSSHILVADRIRPWRAGIGAGVESSPSLWTGGLLQGQIAGRWGWTVGLGYQIQEIPTTELGRTEQIESGFGQNRTQYVSEARSAHRVQAPLGVLYRAGRHWQFEAGVAFSYRVAVRGVIRELTYPKPWERTDGEQSAYETQLSSFYAGQTLEFPFVERSSVYAKGWLDAGKENAFEWRPFAGVLFNAGDRITAQARASYLPGKPWPTDAGQRGLSPWSASLGVYYWIR